MPRFAVLLCLCAAVMLTVGCTSTRKAETTEAEPQETNSADLPAANANVIKPAAAEPDDGFDPIQATLDGEHVPTQVSIMVVPGIGYRVGNHMLELADVDKILGIMAHGNRYADVQIRTLPSGRATMITPVLDVCQQHKLVNVTMWDGR